MSFSTEDEAKAALAAWRQEPASAQRKNIRLAIESLELGQMYYEQKGNTQGIARADRCIVLLRERLAELAADQ